MGKKRGKDKSSREDDDIELTGKESTTYGKRDNQLVVSVFFFIFFCLFLGPSCRHIKKGTDQTLLKKLGNPDWMTCQDCKHEENKENMIDSLSQDSEEDKETPPVWMCLKCGHRVSFFCPIYHSCFNHVYSNIFLIDEINFFPARDVVETLRTSMLSNITKLLGQIRIAWWSV